MKMNPVFIPIGFEDTPTKILDNLNIRYEKLPFDSMLSTPEFIYTIFKLILVDKMEPEEIIDKHFFNCDKKVSMIKTGSYVLDPNGKVLLNSKYNVCFPGDSLKDRDRYLKKIKKLKKILFDKNNYFYFFYVSVSSVESSNYMIDDKQVIKNLYYHMNELDEIFSKKLFQYKILIFDTKNELPIKKTIKEKVYFYDIQARKNKEELMPEIVQKLSSTIIPLIERDIDRLVPGMTIRQEEMDFTIKDIPPIVIENEPKFGEEQKKKKKSDNNIEFIKKINNSEDVKEKKHKKEKKVESVEKSSENKEDGCVIC